MTNACLRRAGGEIADDILRDVFERLPSYQDLLRCAATCKRWRRLVTDPAFLRRIGLWPQTARHPSILAGVFYQNACPAGKPRPKHGDPPEFLNLQLGGAHTDTTFNSFVYGAHLTFGSLVDNDDGLFDLARPLASRRGLLLVSILPPTMFDDMGGAAPDKLQLAVCRPVVDKQRSLLPLLSFDLSGFLDWHLTGCALLTDDDHGDIDYLDQRRPRSTFQVLLTYTGDNGIVYVYMYSSATDSWNTPTECCQASHLIRCGPFAGVVTPNTVHWLYKDETSFYTLDINAITTNVSLTKIPIHVEACRQWGRVLFPCISGEGKLSFVSMRDHSSILVLWTKQEQDDDGYGREASSGGWLGSDLINLGSKDEINNVFYAERRGAMLIERCGGSFFTIDLKSKEKASIDIKGEEMEPHQGYCRFPMYRCSSTWCNGVYGSRWFDFITPVLYEMDWVFDRGMLSTSDQMQDEDGLSQ